MPSDDRELHGSFLSGNSLLLSLLQFGSLFMLADATVPARELTPILVMSFWPVLLTMLLCRALILDAQAKGYGRWWGTLALLGFVGAAVVVSLPDRHDRPRRGFEVKLKSPDQDPR
jgi:hypothetical protein